MNKDTILYTTDVRFEAARKAVGISANSPSNRLHGHSFIAKFRAELPDDATEDSAIDYFSRLATSTVSPLDYDLVNNHIEVPTDENIARYLRTNFPIPRIDLISVQSTLAQGAQIDSNEVLHVWQKFRFEAAHKLPNVAPGHQCGRMHGHGFEIIIHAEQTMNGQSLSLEYEHIQRKWQPLQLQLHNACLNEIDGLENPTSEMISKWIWDKMKQELPSLSWVSVFETVTAGCHYNGKTYRIWKEQRFESAILVPGTTNEARKMLSGHSYLLKLHLTSDLDEIMGWTIDYGDVKSAFKPIYAQLDHHPLHEISALEGTSCVQVLRWIKQNSAAKLPQLDRIELFETPMQGASISWGNNDMSPPI